MHRRDQLGGGLGEQQSLLGVLNDRHANELVDLRVQHFCKFASLQVCGERPKSDTCLNSTRVPKSIRQGGLFDEPHAQTCTVDAFSRHPSFLPPCFFPFFLFCLMRDFCGPVFDPSVTHECRVVLEEGEECCLHRLAEVRAPQRLEINHNNHNNLPAQKTFYETSVSYTSEIGQNPVSQSVSRA